MILGLLSILFLILAGTFLFFVIVHLGRSLIFGFLNEFKAKKYLKKKYPNYKITYLNSEVFENSVLCDLHDGKERLFGSLKFRNKKIVNELNPTPMDTS